MVEAVALNLADNTDARMETLTEIFAADKSKKEWLGFNRIFESNLISTLNQHRQSALPQYVLI